MEIDELSRIDLNLLVALNALSEEKSVSKAARRLRITQPAMSKTLQRLRDTLDDPLFVRTAYGLIPTPRTEQLQEPLARILEQVTQLITPENFNPAPLKRHFHLAMMDVISQTFVSSVLSKLQQQAPGVTLTISEWSRESLVQLSHDRLDLAISLLGQQPASISSSPLFDDEVMCFMRKDHPLVGQELSAEKLVQYPHLKLLIEGYNDHTSRMDELFKNLGTERRIALETPHIMTALSALQGSDMLVFAGSCANAFPPVRKNLHAVRLPAFLKVEPIELKMLWHKRNDHDPAHQWFRTLISEEVPKPVQQSAQPMQPAEPQPKAQQSHLSLDGFRKEIVD
ncbi:LysR family transcriptional regulator [Pelagibaculum spongiae]|uniref:HTH lysR-type domain-containing protein n=1 Tax=Pelagibaculum spongiae TaxID=2080658 RepID=A0A2V1GWF0_9GAMM|nr:LysR family transcriptional regulator [Pelagibaculum spongiae]PVZ69654.1 hypothetical protein DC094_10145 [Pelagibaculum spongiae]